MLMLDGRMVEVGETEKLFTSPEDPRTLAFIRGDMVY
jgi:ABC-type phosphate transport system ATPase subunit